MWIAWVFIGLAFALALHNILGKPVPFLRWSVIRMLLGIKTLESEWQVGDGREEDAARHVIATVPVGNLDATIEAIDKYAYKHKYLINVGDKKGVLLDAAIRRTKPMRVLELGAYIGYSALRICRELPMGAHLYSVEFNAANAAIATRIAAHAGVADRVTFIVGSIGDGRKTLSLLAAQHGFKKEALDMLFIDHDKKYYLSDLESILNEGWLHAGSVVVADNVGFPGAPAYRSYMETNEGKRWRTDTHETHVEYQTLIKDLVLESTLLN